MSPVVTVLAAVAGLYVGLVLLCVAAVLSAAVIDRRGRVRPEKNAADFDRHVAAAVHVSHGRGVYLDCPVCRDGLDRVLADVRRAASWTAADDEAFRSATGGAA